MKIRSQRIIEKYAYRYRVGSKNSRKNYRYFTDQKNCNKHIYRLRVINLYKANYNLLLNMFWPKKATH